MSALTRKPSSAFCLAIPTASAAATAAYDGVLPTPLVYHDPDKELLLTYFPPELGLPVNEQEKLIGPMVTRVMNNLPPEKRKAYLFRPQNMFTLQTMLEKVLEADGITKEMLEAQQRKLNLLQRLASTPPEQRAEVIKQEEALIDEAFFSLLNRLIEVSMAQGDQQSAQVLGMLMQDLLEHTEIGKQIKDQAMEEQQALKSLQEAGKRGLTREKMLELILNAPNENRVNALVSMARSAMDYSFFQLLTETIDQTSAEEEKQKLIQLREKLLQLTAEIDKAVQKQFAEARTLLEKILAQPDVNKALEENAAGLTRPSWKCSTPSSNWPAKKPTWSASISCRPSPMPSRKPAPPRPSWKSSTSWS